MTREEQIEQAWFCKVCLSTHCYDEKSFKEAAKWADKTMVDKACEWFEDVDFEMNYIDSEGLFDKEQFINDFRKAMEE